MRWHALPLLGLIPLLSPFADCAPVPKESAKKLKDVYGEVADPDSKCKCEMTRDGELRVVVPKDAPPLELDHGSRTLPLVTKTVEGDFEVTVRVAHAPPTDAGRAEGAKQQATVSAGIALYAEGDPKTNITFVHKHAHGGGKWTSGLGMQCNYGGGSSGSGRGSPNLEDKPVYLRLTRRGGTITTETSTDGKKWSLFVNHKAGRIGEAVVVGPVAFQNTTGEYEAVFDRYEVKPLTEEKK
jgi:hypothetical protein